MKRDWAWGLFYVVLIVACLVISYKTNPQYEMRDDIREIKELLRAKN